jgi:HPt (histidine-containing phosphotransfer) domain-containing protein
MSETAQEKMAAMVAALWQKNQPQVLERLSLIESAAEAALDGALTTEQRATAEGTAHKLAGSLGMYGFPKGTQLARALEVQLGEAVPDPQVLIVLIAELRGTLYPHELATDR